MLKDERDTTALRDDCIVLTGSSSMGLQEGIADLAGRHGTAAVAQERLLLPMTFRAFCDATGVPGATTAVTPMRPRDVFASTQTIEGSQLSWPALADAWEDYLRIGGFPRAVIDYVTTGDVQRRFIQDLWDVVRGEAFRTMRSTPPEVLALLGRLTANLTTPVNLSSLARDVGLANSRAADGRITDLVSAFLGFRCYQDHEGRPNMSAQRKFYFMDPLLARLAHLVEEAYAEPDASVLSEQQLALAPHRALERERPGASIELTEIRYWVNRTSRTEIDFVGSRLGRGFESKYVDRAWRGESRTLAARGQGGVVATRSVLALDESHRRSAPA